MVRKPLNTAPTAGLLVAVAVTLMERWQNPGGIYQTQDDSQRQIVWQTWSSWFFPVALTVVVLFWGTAHLVFRLCSSRQWELSESMEESGS